MKDDELQRRKEVINQALDEEREMKLTMLKAVLNRMLLLPVMAICGLAMVAVVTNAVIQFLHTLAKHH